MFTTLQQTHHVSRIRHSRWVHISGGFNGIVQTQASSAVLSEDCDDFVFIYRAISEEEKKKNIYNLFREAQSNCQGTILAAELQSALSAQRQLFTGRAWMHFEVQPFLKSQAHSLEREREREEEEEEEEERAVIYAARNGQAFQNPCHSVPSGKAQCFLLKRFHIYNSSACKWLRCLHSKG